MDKLKEYLLRHRSDLDVDSPPGDTWECIESKIPASSGSSKWIVRYAAAACVIALVGVGLWMVIRDKPVPVDTAKQGSVAKSPERGGGDSVRKEQVAPVERVARAGQDAQEGRDVRAEQLARAGRKRRVGRVARAGRTEPADEVDAIDKSYSTLIDYQLRKLRATPLYAESGSYFSFYVEQFKEMDQDERQVRDEIKAYGLTSEFLEQLINVYQQKLNLLKNLETEINKMNNKVREKASPSTKTEPYYLNL